MGRKLNLAYKNDRLQRYAKKDKLNLSPSIVKTRRRKARKEVLGGRLFIFQRNIDNDVRSKESFNLRSNGPNTEVAPLLTGFKRRPRKPKQIEIEVENGQSLISLNGNDHGFQIDSPQHNDFDNGFDGATANLTIQSPSTSKSNNDQLSSADSSISSIVQPSQFPDEVLYFERFRKIVPKIKQIDVVSKPLFNQEDEEDSELSVSSESSEESIRTLSEFDDFEYGDVRDYEETGLENATYAKSVHILESMEKNLENYWSKAIEMDDKRNGIMHDLNKQLKKSKVFPYADVIYFNSRITAIETNLNSLIPVITKLQARYLKGSDRKYVTFFGYKYAKVALTKPLLYSCTFNTDPNGWPFGPVYGCRAMLYLDEKGFLQPGSFIQHFHNSINETGLKLDEPKIEIAVFDRLTSEGKEPGKRAKINELFVKKLHESYDYSLEIKELNLYEENIRGHLNELKLVNVDEMEEADKNYQISSVAWAEFLLLQIKVINVPAMNI